MAGRAQGGQQRALDHLLHGDGGRTLALPPPGLAHLSPFSSAPSSAASADDAAAPFLFTSESVTCGHPDKLCDQVSDAVLDACLRRDRGARVAVECAVKGDEVWIFGELTLREPQQQQHGEPPLPPLDVVAVARRAIAAAGYDGRGGGFSAEGARVRVSLDAQSADIAEGIGGGGGGAGGGRRADDDLGAGDQGHVFGYATDEHRSLMPMTHVLSARLAERLAAVREGTAGGAEAGRLRAWLRPDGKTQVTLEHRRDGGAVVPSRAHTVLISAQHGADAPLDALRAEVERHVVRPVFEREGASALLDARTRVLVNPAGRFVIGGPDADAGLTGRKIIADSYGGWGAHGGGAFSGKDASKVDRSGAYAARQAAKSVVAAGLARRCLVQVAYAIGVAEPLALHVDTYGTAARGGAGAGGADDAIARLLLRAFDWRPAVLRRRLDLTSGGDEATGGRFQRTAAYGHFGRRCGNGEGGDGSGDDVFTWEKVVPLALPS